VIERYEHGMRQLIEMGAKHIFVVGGVDVTKTPSMLTEQGEEKDKAVEQTQEHLEAFKNLVLKLQSEYGRPASDEKPFQWCPADYKYLYDQTHSDRKTFAHHVNVAWLDPEALLEPLRTTPSALQELGFTTLDKGCYNETDDTVCPVPEEFVYWDSFHLSTKVHGVVASTIEKLL
ncbi:hypothetical protein DFQ27_000685, partial [Actinomortierella ambigua]